jgi:hypothetical protein
VVQHSGAQAGAQGIPVDGHGDMRGFSRGGGKIVSGSGPVAQFDERIGLALRDRAGVGLALGGGPPASELLDQGADPPTVRYPPTGCEDQREPRVTQERIT